MPRSFYFLKEVHAPRTACPKAPSKCAYAFIYKRTCPLHFQSAPVPLITNSYGIDETSYQITHQ